MAGEKSVKLHNKSDKPDNISFERTSRSFQNVRRSRNSCLHFLKGFFRISQRRCSAEDKTRIPGMISTFSVDISSKRRI